MIVPRAVRRGGLVPGATLGRALAAAPPAGARAEHAVGSPRVRAGGGATCRRPTAGRWSATSGPSRPNEVRAAG